MSISLLNRDLLISGLSLGILYYYFPGIEILIVGGFYLLLCILWRKLKLLNHRFWVVLTRTLQSLTSPLLFGAIFFLVLVPVSLLYRLWHSRQPERDSTFTEVEQNIDPAFFDVPW